MSTRALVLTLILTGPVLAAPIPPYRPKPPVVPSAGSWVLIWGGTGTGVTLGPGGDYHCRWGGSEWHGSWVWDARTRTFHVTESGDGHTWLSWHAQLDEQLMGEVEVGPRRVPMSLRRASDTPPRVSVSERLARSAP